MTDKLDYTHCVRYRNDSQINCGEGVGFTITLCSVQHIMVQMMIRRGSCSVHTKERRYGSSRTFLDLLLELFGVYVPLIQDLYLV